MTVTSYLQTLSESTMLPRAQERREILVREMELLEGKTIHCFSCPGTCCTGVANSMQISPLEALEILASLEPFDLEVLKNRMQDTINQYRLNIDIYTGKKHSSTLRKTYTCPFFMSGPKGCSLSRSSKPYGCLGFNPVTSEDNGTSCVSNTTLLENREVSYLLLESTCNQKIRADLGISWIKKSIPQALLDIIDKLYT